MIYTDTDFFLTLLKDNDWLKARAVRLYAEHKEHIITSAATIIELLLLSKRFSIDPERLLAAVFAMVPEIIGMTKSEALAAAHYIKNNNFNAFDAVHAAYCRDSPIISSDRIFDTIGMKRVKLEKN